MSVHNFCFAYLLMICLVLAPGSSLKGVVGRASNGELAGNVHEAPIVTTPVSAAITAVGAILGGNVTSDGGSAITERGVIYSAMAANGDPLIGGEGTVKVVSVGTTGDFSVAITGLSKGVRYCYKAFATNMVGTSYTEVANFATEFTAIFNYPYDVAMTSSGYRADGALMVGLGFSPTPFQVLTLVNNTSGNPVEGIFIGFAEAATMTADWGGNTFTMRISYVGGDGNDITLTRVGSSAQVLNSSLYAWTTLAGNLGGVGSRDAPGGLASFYKPQSVAVDNDGNVYVADTNNQTIRKITSNGDVLTLAGSAGLGGSANGRGSSARFRNPSDVAVDSVGNVYVADYSNHTIRKITSDGEVTTLAGSAGLSGSADGAGGSARFSNPTGVAVDDGGNIYVADYSSHTIRKITAAGAVTTWAGSAGVSGSADGVGSSARFNFPEGVAVGSGGNVYVAERGNHTIRKITAAGEVTTLAGSAGVSGSADGVGSEAKLNAPFGVTVDSAGNVFVGDTHNHTIRKIASSGEVTTLAGMAGLSGGSDGSGSAARFKDPTGVAVDSAGNVYVADTFYSTIRKIDAAGEVTTLAGSAGLPGSADGVGSSAGFNAADGGAVDGLGNVYVADQSNHTIRKITTAGEVTTVAGSPGVSGSADGVGAAARFKNPRGVAVDSLGNVYVGDQSNHTIRKITTAGEVTTLAGSAGVSGSADGVGSLARFNAPRGVTVDSVGNVYVADGDNHTIRKVTAFGEVTTLAGSAGQSGSADGIGSAARFGTPFCVEVDSLGNVYVADTNNHTIRKITVAGEVTTLAGSAGLTGSADGIGAAARFRFPRGVTVDSAGNVHVTDYGNHTVRSVASDGAVKTIGGSAGLVGHDDGYENSARFYNPQGVGVSNDGFLYVTDQNNRIIKGRRAGFQPILTQGSVGELGATEVTLRGTVNPNGFVTTAQFEYGTTANYGNTASVSLNLGSGTAAQDVSAKVTGLMPATVYYYRLTATNVDGIQRASAGMFTTLSIQSLTFLDIPDQLTTDSVTLAATGGGSGNPVTFAVTAGPAVITDNVLTFTGAGTVSITASQAGNANYLPAEAVTRSFTVTKAVSSIQFAARVHVDDGSPRPVTFTTAPADLGYDLVYGDEVNAPSAPGVYVVTASLDNPIYTGSGSAELTILGLSGRGQRLRSGSAGPEAANGTDYGRVILGQVATQIFTLSNPGSEPVALTGSPVVQIFGENAGDFVVSVPAEASIPAGGSISFEIRFAPTQPGARRALVQVNSETLANGPITFAVGGFGAFSTLLRQAITLNLPGSLYLSQGPIPLIAIASSNLPVSLTVLSGPATLENGELHLTGPGTVKIEARQEGGGNFAAAKPIVHTLTVKADPSTLTLANLVQTYNGTPRAVTVLGTDEEATVTYLVNNQITGQAPVHAGSYRVTVVAGGVTRKGTLVIARAPLMVQVHDQRKLVGQSNPELTIALSGFIGSDNANNVLTRPIAVTTKAKDSSPPGLYAITSSGGAAANYTFIHRSGTLVVEGYAGSFEALLRDPETEAPAGLLKLTVPSTSRSASASLALAGEAKPLALAGSLALNALTRVADGSFTGSLDASNYELRLQLTLFGELSVQVRRNGQLIAHADDGIRLRTLIKGEAVPQQGTYTAVLARTGSEIEPSAPGWAAARVDAGGTLTLTGKLGDGTGFSASLPADLRGGYRLFALPYKRAGAYLGGTWNLVEHPQVAESWRAREVELTWVKGASAKDAGYRDGFGPLMVVLSLDPWQVPGRAISLAQLLGAEQWEFDHAPTGSSSEALLASLVGLDDRNTLQVLEPVTNPLNLRKWKAKINLATGVFTGSFELLDVTQKRKVTFGGVLRQEPDVGGDGLQGQGHYLLPTLQGAASTEKTTGAIQLMRPE